MQSDTGLGVIILSVVAVAYLLPSIIVTLRGCRRAWLYWILNLLLGWSVCVSAYLLFRAVFIEHKNDDQYSRFPYVFRD